MRPSGGGAVRILRLICRTSLVPLKWECVSFDVDTQE